MPKNSLFYNTLESFTDFEKIAETALYRPVPDDWCVFITDVKGSTDAIERGRYKEVNTVGAASIVCAQNAMNGQEFPFVFGGDGATLLVPSEFVDVVSQELCALKKLSLKRFGLSLRVGTISMGDLKAKGGEVRVAKFEFVKGRSVAVFKGGGLTLAENMIKSDPEKHSVEIDGIPEPDLTGLSCRWQPISNKNGKVLSLLVMARNSQDDSVYNKVLAKLNEVFAGQIDDANPVNVEKLKYRSPIQCFREDVKFHLERLNASFFLRCFETLVAVSLFRFGWFAKLFGTDRYVPSMRSHSDYRKFDDMLRMVVDCSQTQHEEIEDFLSKLHHRGDIFFGLHESQESLMTCFVHQLTDGEHIHFVDGANGGYAMAAKQLKMQIKALSDIGIKAA